MENRRMALKAKRFGLVSERFDKTRFSYSGNRFLEMAGLFAPGSSYYYIKNYPSEDFDYIDESIKDVLGISPECFSERLIHPQDLENYSSKKELLTRMFYDELHRDEISNYKALYFLRIRDANGRYRVIQNQSTPYEISSDGAITKGLFIHTDVSHFESASFDTVSVINLYGGKSFYNMVPDKISFGSDSSESFEESLTGRELEIVSLLSEGLSAEGIAEELDVSFNTVRTHRKNMLRKTGCKNTTELVARSLRQGVI